MNPGMRMYMMTQEGEGSRMATEDGKYQERGIGMDEYGYPKPEREPRPEFGETEARYRGEDGRWKSGTRRSEYSGRAESRMRDDGGQYRTTSKRGNGSRRWEVSVEPKNTRYIDPYMPYDEGGQRGMRRGPSNAYRNEMSDYGRMGDDEEEDPTGRVIGFSTFRNHMESKKKHQESERGQYSMDEMEFGREQAMDWVEGMKNEDPKHPKGPKWDENFLKPMAQKLGIPASGPEFWKFFAVTNAKYSDYSEILKKYGVTNPMCFAEMAAAFINDKDAIDEKTETYYECIVLPAREEES